VLSPRRGQRSIRATSWTYITAMPLNIPSPVGRRGRRGDRALPHRGAHALRRPHRPLSGGGLSTQVRVAQLRLGQALERYGPHELRHANATWLDKFTCCGIVARDSAGKHLARRNLLAVHLASGLGGGHHLEGWTGKGVSHLKIWRWAVQGALRTSPRSKRERQHEWIAWTVCDSRYQVVWTTEPHSSMPKPSFLLWQRHLYVRCSQT
jgi:hypothetical protein